MAATDKSVIILGDPRQKEYKIIEASVLPGMLMESAPTGIQKHSTAGGTAAKLFLFEGELLGADINTAPAISSQVQVLSCQPGDEINGLLADGEAATIGAFAESAGTGYLRVVDADASVGDVGVQSVVGFFMEALDMSGSSGVDPASQRVRIEVM